LEIVAIIDRGNVVCLLGGLPFFTGKMGEALIWSSGFRIFLIYVWDFYSSFTSRALRSYCFLGASTFFVLSETSNLLMGFSIEVCFWTVRFFWDVMIEESSSLRFL